MKIIKKIEVDSVVKTQCDKCRSIIYDKEECSINYTFGYGSERDGDRISLDICHKCIENVLGEKLFKKGIEEGQKLMEEGF